MRLETVGVGVGSQAQGTRGQATSRSGLLLAIFLAALIIPISVDLAGQRLSPYRILLLIMFVPFLIQLVSGRAGKLTATDACLLAFGTWIVVTLTYHHGTARLPYGVILAVEVLGGYMMGRLMIRNAADYRRFIRYFLVVLLFMLPFAVYEFRSGRMLLPELLHSVFEVTKKNQEYRYGFSRVQVVFPHSILYGVFCSIGLASTFYIYRRNIAQMIPRFVLVIVMTLMSLSSGPLLSMGMQLLMIVWNKVTRGSWRLLASLTAGIYVFLQVFSNRGAVVIFIETMTLSPQSGWWRIHIWRYGSAAVMNNPIMGIGLNDWERPTWLTSSVDNFWLLTAMRHGLVGIGLLGLAIALHSIRVIRAKGLAEDARDIQTGYGITLVGLLFVLSTVYIWNEMVAFVFFFFGAGAFLYTGDVAAKQGPEPIPDSAPLARQALPLSRFPHRSGLRRPSLPAASSRTP